MSDSLPPFIQLLNEDPRYAPDAYQFVREALTYAHDVMKLGAGPPIEESDEPERHLTGQELCEAIRRYAQEQYGLMARVVLNSWGITKTGDFGEIVYNMIRIEVMKKSPSDQREDFDDVYDFEQAFQQFEITMPE